MWSDEARSVIRIRNSGIWILIRHGLGSGHRQNGATRDGRAGFPARGQRDPFASQYSVGVCIPQRRREVRFPRESRTPFRDAELRARIFGIHDGPNAGDTERLGLQRFVAEAVANDVRRRTGECRIPPVLVDTHRQRL